MRSDSKSTVSNIVQPCRNAFSLSTVQLVPAAGWPLLPLTLTIPMTTETTTEMTRITQTTVSATQRRWASNFSSLSS